MAKVLKVLFAISTLIFLCACSKTAVESKAPVYQTTIPSVPSTTPYVLTTQQSIIAPLPETSIIYSEVQLSVADESLYTTTEIQTTTSPQTTEEITTTITETIPPSTTEKVYEKTGEMAFSDSSDNKYIKAVSSKYGVNAENLVALYTVPDNDGNIVLEFDGSTDSQGKLIRNDSTLIAIYSIDKNLNSKRASENSELNEYSYGEMKVMYFTTTTYIMPEFESELKG